MIRKFEFVTKTHFLYKLTRVNVIWKEYQKRYKTRKNIKENKKKKGKRRKSSKKKVKIRNTQEAKRWKLKENKK